MFYKIISIICLFFFINIKKDNLFGQQKISAIYSGVPWFDNNRNKVAAHGACVIKNNNNYYLFGEKHSDTSNAFEGINCYVSKDLCNWKFANIALPLQPFGKLGKNRIGERPKVMKCPATGEYIMYLHVDTLGYKDQFLGYATATKINGPYQFQGALLWNGKPIKKWDMGTFQNEDGNGYVLLHGGDIYKLNSNYKSIDTQICKAFEKGFESPTMFKKDSIFYFLGSNLTGWERNDNYYFTATSINGPWIKQGLIAPEGTLTWNSQCTFVLPIKGNQTTTYMYMGDRWSYPKQNSAATYVWQPLLINGSTISMPQFQEAWNMDTKKGVTNDIHLNGITVFCNDSKINYFGLWKNDIVGVKNSNNKNDYFSFSFNGKQIALYSLNTSNGGYASIEITNKKGKRVIQSVVDMYAKYTTSELKFLSPILEKDEYYISVTVLGDHWSWKEKSGKLSGSNGDFVSIEKIIVLE